MRQLSKLYTDMLKITIYYNITVTNCIISSFLLTVETNNNQLDEVVLWQAEVQQRLQQENEFLRQLRARKEGPGRPIHIDNHAPDQ